MTTLLAGFFFGLGLIVAIGAQNIFVIRQGLQRRHVSLVVAVCILSDVALICVGTADMGQIVIDHPNAMTIATVLGVGVLAWYGLHAAWRVFRPHPTGMTVDASDRHSGTTARGSAITLTRPATRTTLIAVLALTWLNPHVYLDTVVLLGSTGTTYANPWVFAAGASLASAAWFSLIGFGASAVAPAFTRPLAWRIFDGCVAVIMIGFAIHLAGNLIPSAT